MMDSPLKQDEPGDGMSQPADPAERVHIAAELLHACRTEVPAGALQIMRNFLL